MLLTQLIAQQQSNYAQIQVQIEALQEQQRQIQAYLQRLGSVESQMVSAAQVLQEAIASINEVCPDELTGYKDLIYGLFNKPLAVIEGGKNDDDSTDPDPTDPDPTPSIESLPEDESEVIEATAVEVADEKPLVLQKIALSIASMSYTQIKSELGHRRLNNKGNHASLKERLIEHYQDLDMTELRAIALLWTNPQQKTA